MKCNIPLVVEGMPLKFYCYLKKGHKGYCKAVVEYHCPLYALKGVEAKK